MRRSEWFVTFFAFVAGLVAVAQRPGPLPVTGQPFTAVRTMTSVQRLADGTTIEHHTSSEEARDSQGRTWSRTKLKGDPLQPQTPERFMVTTYDPETRTGRSWCTCNKVVTVTHFGEPLPRRTERDPGAEGMDVYLGPSTTSRLKYHAEDLPPQTLMGVWTRGSKAVRTLPVGADGNDRELTTTIESWYSPELRLALVTIIDDPVNGLKKYEFQDLKRVEPPPEIFDVPNGYVVRESSR